MSSRYGIVYLLANGSRGVIFNDGTSLTKKEGGCFAYFDKKVEEYASALPL